MPWSIHLKFCAPPRPRNSCAFAVAPISIMPDPFLYFTTHRKYGCNPPHYYFIRQRISSSITYFLCFHFILKWNSVRRDGRYLLLGKLAYSVAVAFCSALRFSSSLDPSEVKKETKNEGTLMMLLCCVFLGFSLYQRSVAFPLSLFQYNQEFLVRFLPSSLPRADSSSPLKTSRVLFYVDCGLVAWL